MTYIGMDPETGRFAVSYSRGDGLQGLDEREIVRMLNNARQLANRWESTRRDFDSPAYHKHAQQLRAVLRPKD